jgi:AcrR family transcriptional regulator
MATVEERVRRRLPLAERRELVVEAAGRLFGERGYDGTRVQEIARRAGLTTGAIYANFRGKADLLFEAIGARSADELDDLLRSNTAALSAGELLAELGSHLLDPADDGDGATTGGLLIEAFVAARRDDDLGEHDPSLKDERQRAIGGIVEQARREVSVADDDSGDALSRFGIVLALGSLLYTSIGIDRPDAGEWSTLIHRIVRSFKEDTPRES